MVNSKPAADNTILRRVQLILEAEGLGSASLTQKVSALQIGAVLDLNSKASAAPTQSVVP